MFRLVPSASAWNYDIVHEFTGGPVDGGGPLGGVIFDGAGNAYGTTSFGGASGHGTVFRLTAPGTRRFETTWTLQTIYNFAGGTDGAIPFGALTFDTAGTLYGTTSIGGHGHVGCLAGCGTIFRLAPTTRGRWKETVLHRFLDAFRQGAEPRAGLTFDAAGDLFGTTYYGGDDSGCSGLGCGTLFELARRKSGRWQFHTLHEFEVSDGAFPRGPVTLDGKGNLFGTTMQGGAANDGTVFAFRDASGRWLPSTTYSFHGVDGRMPSGRLSIDANGTLYGSTFSGGSQFWGTVFTLTTGSAWTEHLLYSYTDASDGATPLDANIIFDAQGNLYTTASQGGGLGCDGAGCGTVVELTGARR